VHRIETLIELCVKELELCGVHEEESVAVLSHGKVRASYAEAFMIAAARLGARPYEVRLQEAATSASGESGAWTVGATPIDGNRPVVEALKAADMVVDLITLLFSREQMEILTSGTRMLLCVEPVDNLARMFPTRETRERVEAGGELLAKARTLRFTNAAGTDVTYQLGTYPVHLQYGYTDTPGRWDHWPSAMCATAGADDGVDGRVVLAPGDILLPFKRYVSAPVEFTIEHGQIVDIRGGFDADLIKDYMEAFGDPKANGISHIGWGMMDEARWSGLALDTRSMQMEARSFAGNVLFATGPNAELGGPNDSLCHLDIPMRNCDLFLDAEPVVLGGKLVAEELRGASAAYL
jgi:2,5-dihydroxypyridine 5,6-dioxygenase